MKIFDCFMYFNEDLILELRLNTLDKYVDYFVIVESIYNHKGDKRNLHFDPNKFQKFKEKIIYLTHDKTPDGIEKIYENDSEHIKSQKYIMNAVKRENGQRNYIASGLNNSDQEDLIMISDVDEIPNLSKNNLKNLNKKIILFQQQMFYYKFNLKVPKLIWTGTKACKKKYLTNPQWLRNVKDRKYSFYRLDTLFSKNKYIDVKIIKDGGWHFTNIKKPEEIKLKLKSYLHHREFEIDPLTTDQIKKIIENKKTIYDLNVDKRSSKFGGGINLQKIDLDKLPNHITENKKKYEEWLD